MKKYSREYYDRWYRDPATRITSAAETARKVRLAVAAAEYMLGRKVESVLDVGCGTGSWRAPLLRFRPLASYTGVEASDYVIAEFGKSRNIIHGTFGRLGKLDLDVSYDLVVCADVVQYVPDDELRRGLKAIRRMAAGVVYVETFADEDGMEGDHEGWFDRSARTISRLFNDAGLTHCGFYCWIDERQIENANRFEIALGGA